MAATAYSCALSSPACQPLGQLLLQGGQWAPESRCWRRSEWVCGVRGKDLGPSHFFSNYGQPSVVQCCAEACLCLIKTDTLRKTENRGSNANRLGGCDLRRALRSPPVWFFEGDSNFTSFLLPQYLQSGWIQGSHFSKFLIGTGCSHRPILLLQTMACVYNSSHSQFKCNNQLLLIWWGYEAEDS